MKISIKKDELMELSYFMWDRFEEKGIPERISSMVGQQYGEAMAKYSYSDGLYCVTYALYRTHSNFYGEIYILVEDSEDGENIYILPIEFGCTIEVED